MNNAAFVSFLAHVSAHDSLFASTEFLAQRFIHCFAVYSLLLFVLYPTICIFRSVETFSLSLSLSFSLRIRLFLFPHTVENRTHVRSPPSISLSLLLRQVNAKANARRTLCIYIYTRVGGSTREHSTMCRCIDGSKVSDRVCRDPRRYGVDRRERTRFFESVRGRVVLASGSVSHTWRRTCGPAVLLKNRRAVSSRCFSSSPTVAFRSCRWWPRPCLAHARVGHRISIRESYPFFFLPSFDLELLLLLLFFFLARSSNRRKVFSGVRFVLGNRLIYVYKCESRLLLSDCCLTKWNVRIGNFARRAGDTSVIRLAAVPCYERRNTLDNYPPPFRSTNFFF